MMIYVVLLSAIVGLFLLSRKDSNKAGEDKEKIDAMKEAADDIYTAKLARDRINSDSKRVRDKYTRD